MTYQTQYNDSNRTIAYPASRKIVAFWIIDIEIVGIQRF